MREFQGLEDLIKFIKEDKKDHNIYAFRYPVRIIFFPIFEDYCEFLPQLPIESKKIDISELLTKQNWFTVKDMIDVIRDELKSQDLILINLSNLLRFFKDEEILMLFNFLIEFENKRQSTERRIYVPLVGLYNRFSKLIKRIHKHYSDYVILSLKNKNHISEKINLYIIQFNLKIEIFSKEVNLIQETREWLKFGESFHFKNNGNYYIIADSLKILGKNEVLDEIFNFINVFDYKDLIKIEFGINMPFPVNSEEFVQWEYLFICINEAGAKIKDLQDYIKVHFNVNQLDRKNFVTIWERSEVSDKWFLRNLVLTDKEWQGTYLYHILLDLKVYDKIDLIKKIYITILTLQNLSQSFLEERYEYLKQSSNTILEFEAIIFKDIQEIFNELYQQDKKQFIKILTGFSRFEINRIISLSQEIEKKDYLSFVKQVFPEIFYYLYDENLFIDYPINWIKNYFDLYRWIKIKHDKKEYEKLKLLLDDVNKNENSFYEWYYKVSQPSKLLNDWPIERTIFIDNVGIEWLPFICNYVRAKDFFIEKCQICRANIPTTTKYNKMPGIKDQYNEFDKLKHKAEAYKHPDDFCNQIRVLKSALDKILAFNWEKILVFSDHGSTLMGISYFTEISNKYKFEGVEHEGRLSIEKIGNLKSNEDFVVIDLDNQKGIVPLKHISLSERPKRECHGGATPEEILIPTLIISKTVPTDVTFKINLITEEIRKTKPVVIFKIEPIPTQIPVLETEFCSVQGHNEEDKKVWSFKLESDKLKKSEKVTLLIGMSFKKEFSIKIKTGLSEVTDFDF